MCNQLMSLLVRFVKPEVVTAHCKVYEVEFTDESNQKSDEELFVGQAARTHIIEYGEQCNLKQFYDSVRSYFSSACSYMRKSYPFEEEVLQNADVLDVSKRTQVQLNKWLFFANKFPQFVPEDERDQLEDLTDEILKPDLRINSQ